MSNVTITISGPGETFDAITVAITDYLQGLGANVTHTHDIEPRINIGSINKDWVDIQIKGDQLILLPKICRGEDKLLPKPLDEINDASQAIQSALSFDNLKDAIGFICSWEEHQRKKMGFKESFSGFCVGQLLFVYGIDISKIGRR